LRNKDYPVIDDVTDIAASYNDNPEAEHRRLEYNQLEYDLTWRYLEGYLPPQGTILEVGAATGRYTVELARRGYRITAVDLSAGLIEKCRQSLIAEGLERQVQLAVADARNLSDVSGQDFDVVLLMGPLYHLIVKADRELALKEASARLRPGGLLISVFLSRFGVLGHLVKNVPAWIEDGVQVRSMLEKGHRPDEYPRGGFRGYFAQVPEIAPLHEALGFETLVVAGIEPTIAADDESYNKLQANQRRLWLDLLYEISTEKSIIGASRHLLYIGRKQKM
jgi:S-adenosylmethionine-dependent methyltransferase